jgi:hypothetical protein
MAKQLSIPIRNNSVGEKIHGSLRPTSQRKYWGKGLWTIRVH